jgi:LuxR family maltose regulon positive regulatory protein
MSGYVALAYVRQAQGDADGVREVMQTAQQIAVRFDATEMDDMKVAMHQARLWLAQGNVTEAARWVEERGLDTAGSLDGLKPISPVSTPILYEYEQITAARVLIAQGRSDRALVQLEHLLSKTETAGWTRFVIEVLILEALAHQARGAIEQALPPLRRALSLARPEGYERIFVDEGKPLAGLLYEAGARGVMPEYVGQLLAAIEVGTKEQEPTVDLSRSSSGTRPLALIEPLSERELDVLQLVADGLSNQEVAQRLYLSLHTVKWHTGNIYGKLGVKNRTQAVAKARALGVLVAA